MTARTCGCYPTTWRRTWRSSSSARWSPTASVSRGHYYAGPGNKFWELLWEAGLTGDRILTAEQDTTILKYGLGLTDVVKGRASSSDSLLRRGDYDIEGFLAKVSAYNPCIIAFNGKEAARRVFRHLGREQLSLGRTSWQIGATDVIRASVELWIERRPEALRTKDFEGRLVARARLLGNELPPKLSSPPRQNTRPESERNASEFAHRSARRCAACSAVSKVRLPETDAAWE